MGTKSKQRGNLPVRPEPGPSSLPAAPFGRLSKRLTRTQRRAEKAYERAEEFVAVADQIDSEAAPPSPDVEPTEQTSERFDHALQRARASRARALAKTSARASDPKQLAKRETYVRAMDRFFEPPKLGLLRRLVARVASWRRRRLHRAMVLKLDRALDRGDLRVEDQQSSALLDVVTERIARLSNTSASRPALDATIALAQRLSNDYRAYVARLGAARAATSPTSPLYAKATIELARCEAGQHRIDDALTQLRALASRVKAPG